MKYYAVRKGKKTGIYTTWEDCKKQVDKYPGAIFKSFISEDEASEFLSIQDVKKETPKDKIIQTTEDDCVYETDINGDIVIPIFFVDGSYNIKTQEYSYGLILLNNNYKTIEKSEKFNDSYRSLRNVAGELRGAMKAFSMSVEGGYKRIKLFYDFEGIEKWCTKEWSAKNEFTKEYANKYEQLINQHGVSVEFVKVKSHSGNYYNEYVDKLAKKALGL